MTNKEIIMIAEKDYFESGCGVPDDKLMLVETTKGRRYLVRAGQVYALHDGDSTKITGAYKVKKG
mgnify:CR=1 FL=1